MSARVEAPCRCGKRTVYANAQSTVEFRGHKIGPSIWHERHACGTIEEVRAAAGEEPLPGTPAWRAARSDGSATSAPSADVEQAARTETSEPPPPVAPPAACMCLFPAALASRCVTCGGALA